MLKIVSTVVHIYSYIGITLWILFEPSYVLEIYLETCGSRVRQQRKILIHYL